MSTLTSSTEWVQILPVRNWAEDIAAAPEPRVKLPKGWEAQCREEYDLYLMYRYLAAEEATVGYFLNDRGRAAGADNYNMFYRPWSQVRGYAGEELLAWVAEHGESLTYTAFRAQYRAGVEVV